MLTTTRERPILLSQHEVLAILAGRKTQRRDVIRPHPPAGWARHCWFDAPVYGWTNEPEPALEWFKSRCPGLPGDRLWGKESAYIAPPNFGEPGDGNTTDSEGRRRIVGYAVSMDGEAVRCAEEYGVKKTPSIHMPRWASRITLEITDVRVERLQAISEADALAEGMTARLLGEILEPLAARSRPGPPYRLAGVDDEATTYCRKCAEKRLKHILVSEPECHALLDGGWLTEEDGRIFCGTCGVDLDFTPTDYGVNDVLDEFGVEGNAIRRPGDAHAVHAMLGWHGNPILTESCGDFDYMPEVAGKVAKICFRHLWDARRRKPGESWGDNPWVWVRTFKRVEAG